MIWDGTRVVLFGGYTGVSNAETWIYESGDWTQLSPATSPPGRALHRMIWDGSRILMFGGTRSGTPFLGDLWQFAGGTWTQLSAGGGAGEPTPRYWHSMVWDGSRVLLYGGTDGIAGKPNDETWEYVSGAWNQLSPANTPASVPGGTGTFNGRFAHRMVWNGVHVVLLGGRSNSNVYPSTPSYETGGNTWIFSSGNWTQPGPVTQPGERYGHVMTVTDGGKALVFSGEVSHTGSFGSLIDPATWVYDNTNWTDMAESVNPGARLDSDMVWDVDGDRAILFGGEFYTSSSSHAPVNDTWEYAAVDL